jgi:hypothetical protein
MKETEKETECNSCLAKGEIDYIMRLYNLPTKGVENAYGYWGCKCEELYEQNESEMKETKE